MHLHPGAIRVQVGAVISGQVLGLLGNIGIAGEM
jgi:hypothetical protein